MKKIMFVKYHGQIEDLTGQKFGQWTVVRFVGGSSAWLCRCSCGTELKVTKTRLRDLTKCKRCFRLPEGEAAFRELYLQYRRNAKKADRNFTLSLQQAKDLFQTDCYYCGVKPCGLFKSSVSSCLYNGIDRVQNDLGYVEGNCVPCCRICNHMKHVLSYEEFLIHVSRICEHRGKV